MLLGGVLTKCQIGVKQQSFNESSLIKSLKLKLKLDIRYLAENTQLHVFLEKICDSRRDAVQ